VKLNHYIRRALSLPPHIVFLKVCGLILFQIKSYFLEIRDLVQPTYSKNHEFTFNALFDLPPSIDSLKNYFPELDALVDKTVHHNFDLLGSGWVQVFHGMECDGILGIKFPPDKFAKKPEPGDISWVKGSINKANRSASEDVWMNITSGYSPIDWHLDFKSGYRWNPKTWWYRVPYGHLRGVDVKVPWELARAQHLPWLAMKYGKSNSHVFAQEFENQVLDFIASNPPRFGVNWRCAMDVAIRAANWILAYEWLRLYGWNASTNFKQIFANSLNDHGDFIFSNLEIGSDGFRGNHYLADICGLSYISLFLPGSKKTNQWKDFSLNALKEEMEYQFFEEGSNFEGSTSYHRLSSEMILYATIIFLIKDPKSFPDSYLQRLYKTWQFSDAVTRPDGDIVQIGDCDSGRFFKIQPLFNESKFNECHLTHRCLIDSVRALFENDCSPSTVEGWWIKDLSIRTRLDLNPELYHLDKVDKWKLNLPLNFPKALTQLITDHIDPTEDDFEELGLPHQTQYLPELSVGPIESFYYPEFGIYIWKSENSFFSFRCGSVGQKGRGGHDHNDQLSIEFHRNDQLLKYDPGTAIYTPFPDIRNRYRSVSSHTGPLVEDHKGELIEPCPLNQGLFSLKGQQSGLIIRIDDRQLVGYCERRKAVRVISSSNGFVRIFDILLNPKWQFRVLSQLPPPLSLGYGVDLEM
jgi:hypothetical protein